MLGTCWDAIMPSPSTMHLKFFWSPFFSWYAFAMICWWSLLGWLYHLLWCAATLVRQMHHLPRLAGCHGFSTALPGECTSKYGFLATYNGLIDTCSDFLAGLMHYLYGLVATYSRLMDHLPCFSGCPCWANAWWIFCRGSGLMQDRYGLLATFSRLMDHLLWLLSWWPISAACWPPTSVLASETSDQRTRCPSISQWWNRGASLTTGLECGMERRNGKWNGLVNVCSCS